MIVAIRFEEYWIVFAFKIEFVFNFWRYNLDIQNASFIGWLNCLRIWKPYHFVLPLNENWQKCLEIAINGLVLIRFSWIASGFENFDSATISFFTGIEFSWNTIFWNVQINMTVLLLRNERHFLSWNSVCSTCLPVFHIPVPIKSYLILKPSKNGEICESEF
jgi:hypothetical protein